MIQIFTCFFIVCKEIDRQLEISLFLLEILISSFCFPVNLERYSYPRIILKSLLLVSLGWLWTFASGLLALLVFLIWILFGPCLACWWQLYLYVSLCCSNLFFLPLFSFIFDFYAASHSLFNATENLSRYFCLLFILFALILIIECELNL